VSYYAHACTHGRHKKTGHVIARISAARWPMFLAILIASLVQGHRGNGKLHRLDIRIDERLCLDESGPEVADGRHVVGVHADERARLESAVQRALSLCDLRSSIGTGSGELDHATAGRLDSLDGRRSRIVREDERGAFRVQVGVAVLNESEGGTDVAESESIIGGGCKENNVVHVVVSFRDGRALVPSTVYIIADDAPEVQQKVCKVCKAFVKLPGLLLVSAVLFILVIYHTERESIGHYCARLPATGCCWPAVLA